MSCKNGCDIIFFKFMDFIFKDGNYCIALIFNKRTDNALRKQKSGPGATKLEECT